MTMAGCVRRRLRHPALHFAVLGALLFAAHVALRPQPEPERVPLVLGLERIERLKREYASKTGLAPTPEDVRALVAREIDEEVLYREALALGLDRRDRGVQWRLIEKMTFLGGGEEASPDRAVLLEEARSLGFDRDDVVVRRILIEQMRQRLKYAGSVAPPADAELEAWLDEQRERFTLPARARLSQVFLSRDRRGEALAGDAAALLERLRRQDPQAQEAAALGDPFPLESDAGWTTDAELAARFGEEFAAAVAALEPGRWSAPVASPFGLHLVFVHERTPPGRPSLAAVRGNVLYGLLAERREASFERGLRRLRERYDVRVEWPASAGQSRS